jgi:predicted phage terminase large subunit-like protein
MESDTARNLRIERLAISELKLDPRNPKQHSARQIRQIAESIKTFGCLVPVLIDRDNKILAGHGRVLALRRLGWAEVPVIRVEHLTPERARAFSVADKRLTELSTWDERDYPDLKRRARELAQLYRADTVLIEDKASGTQLIQDLKNEYVFSVTPYSPPPGTDKIMRLYAQTAVFENGRVLMPRRASWLADYLNELTSFPGSKYDDQVDSTTQALHHMRENSSGLAVWRRLARL